MKITSAVKGEENHNHCVTGEREPCLGNLGIAQRSLWLLGHHLYPLSGDIRYMMLYGVHLLWGSSLVYKFISCGHHLYTDDNRHD